MHSAVSASILLLSEQLQSAYLNKQVMLGMC
jgi:hypothetical protein